MVHSVNTRRRSRQRKTYIDNWKMELTSLQVDNIYGCFGQHGRRATHNLMAEVGGPRNLRVNLTPEAYRLTVGMETIAGTGRNNKSAVLFPAHPGGRWDKLKAGFVDFIAPPEA